MLTGLALEHLWWGYTFAESRLSLHQCKKPQNLCLLTVWFLYKLAFYFTFDDPMRTNRQKHCSLWLCHVIGVLIYGLTDKSDTVVEFHSDRCFFLLWLPNFRKFCMSKHSCSYVIIVPWNHPKTSKTSKNDYYSLFLLCREGSGESVHLHRLTWVFVLVLTYHVLAQITIYVPFIRTVNAVVRLHQQPQEFCATISALYQCVKKCSQCVVIKKSAIKHLLVYQENKKQSSNRFLDVISWENDNSCA